MSNFWIDDMEDMTTVLKTLNERLELELDDPDSAISMEVAQPKKDKWEHIVIHGTEYTKNPDKGENPIRKEFTMDFNMYYQSVDEVVYDLKKLMGIDQ